jgi:hypothetical protein
METAISKSLLPASASKETMDPEKIVARVNQLKYPPTIYSHGWIYGVWSAAKEGDDDQDVVSEIAKSTDENIKADWVSGVWYCGTGFQKAIYYGQFPMTFVKRVTAMFPTNEFKFLHLCCGKCHIDGATNVDVREASNFDGTDMLQYADVIADVENLPTDIFPENSYDVCLIDPPYSQEDSSRYGVARLVSPKKVFAQLARIIAPGGWVLWLDEKFPNFPKEFFELMGLINVVSGANRRVRIVAMYRRLG